MSNRKGFTLLEILIVLVILAVLAGLAVPSYISAVEKQRKQEAISNLGAVRSSQQRYFATHNNYAHNTYADLDFDPTAAMAGNVVHFTYGTPQTTAAAVYSVTATRNAVQAPPVTVAPAGYTVTINQDGSINSQF